MRQNKVKCPEEFQGLQFTAWSRDAFDSNKTLLISCYSGILLNTAVFITNPTTTAKKVLK